MKADKKIPETEVLGEAPIYLRAGKVGAVVVDVWHPTDVSTTIPRTAAVGAAVGIGRTVVGKGRDFPVRTVSQTDHIGRIRS